MPGKCFYRSSSIYKIVLRLESYNFLSKPFFTYGKFQLPSDFSKWDTNIKCQNKSVHQWKPTRNDLVAAVTVIFSFNAVLVNWSFRKRVFTGDACKTCLPQIGIFKLSPSVWKKHLKLTYFNFALPSRIWSISSSSCFWRVLCLKRRMYLVLT